VRGDGEKNGWSIGILSAVFILCQETVTVLEYTNPF
jgi:hypothetical protein